MGLFSFFKNKQQAKTEPEIDITAGCDRAEWYHLGGGIPINILSLFSGNEKINEYRLCYHRIGKDNLWEDKNGNEAPIKEARQAFKLMCRLQDETIPVSSDNSLTYTIKL